MEALLGIVFFGGMVALGFILKRDKSRPAPPLLQNLDTLGTSELEKAWIDVKAQLMETDAYADEIRYSRLHDQASRLRDRLLSPYKRLLDAANVAPSIFKYARLPFAKVLSIDPAFTATRIGDEVALGLSLYCYTGVALQSKQYLGSDHHTYTRLLDELITRDCSTAYLLKGLILKYGMTLTAPPQLAVAEKYLMEAHRRGIEGAGKETSFLRAHARLESTARRRLTDAPTWE